MLRNTIKTKDSLLFLLFMCTAIFFFQAEDGIRDQPRSRGLGDVYKRQAVSSMWLDLIYI